MKKIALSILYGFFTFLSVLIYSKIIFKFESYNFLLIILFLFLCLFFYKINIICDKRTKMYSIILAVILSLILSIGSIVSSYVYFPAVDIFNLKNIIYLTVSLFGFVIFFYRVFILLFLKVKTIKLFEEHDKMKIRYLLLICVIILISYLFVFIRYYPAIMTSDSYYVLHYANDFILSDFHSFGHTWFVGIFLHLGKFLFNNINMAVGLSTIVQMICLIFMFSYTIKYLYDKGLNKKVTIVLVLIYALNPLFAHYSVTLWRDVMFGGAFVIFLISLYDLISEKNVKVSNIILFVISVIIILFFRNNGIYVFLFTIPFIIFILKDKRKLMSILCASLLLFYFVIKGPVFKYFNVEKTTSVEAFSIPLQQIARVISSDKTIPESNLEYFKKLFVYDKVKSSYNPAISDPIKNITNDDVLNNKKEFFKNYLYLFLKYPNVYFDAYFLQTLGYWYPDVIYWATAQESSSIFANLDVHSVSITPSWYNKIIDISVSRKVPLNNIIWSVGLPFIILVCSSFLMFYLNNKKYILCFIPLYGLWISIMLATPVFAELRYIFGLFTCAPIMLIVALNNNFERNDIND